MPTSPRSSRSRGSAELKALATTIRPAGSRDARRTERAGGDAGAPSEKMDRLMPHASGRHSHWMLPSAVQTATSTQEGLLGVCGSPFRHSAYKVTPRQDDTLHAPHFGRGGGKSAAGEAGRLWPVETEDCCASSGQDGESAKKSGAAAGCDSEAFASPARHGAGTEMRSSSRADEPSASFFFIESSSLRAGRNPRSSL